MQFIDVELKNFRSHEDTRYNFKDQGLTLIEGENLDEGGSNGAGKSTLWDGISWCLFGETTSGIKGDEVINRISKKNCEVKVHLKVRGKRLFVSRYRNDEKNKNNLVYNYEGEKPVVDGTTALTQKKLLDELEIDLDLFKTTVLFAQGKTFNFVDETDKRQKEILGKIVRISFENVLKNAKEKFKEISDEINGVDLKIEKLNSRIEASSLNSYIEASKNFDEVNNDEIRKCISTIKETQKQEKQILKKYEPLTVEACEQNIRESIPKLENKIDEIDSYLKSVESKRMKISIKRHDIENSISRMRKLGGTCDNCGQYIDEEKTKEKLRDSELMLVKLNSIEEKLPIKDEIANKESYKEEIRLLIGKSEELARDAVKLDSLEEYISNKKNEIKDIKERKNIWVEKIAEEERLLSEIKDKISEIEKKSKQSKDELAYWQFWVNGFGDKGIKSFIFDTICGQLTSRSNYFLNLLSNGSLSISFDTQKKLKSGDIREKFEVVVSKDGESIEYSTFSGGEKRRISLAVDMALADLMKDFYGSDFNIVVFDEQTSYMDKEGRECFMSLLKEQSRNKSVFVVDHDAEFKTAFDEVLNFKKENGVTTIG